MKKLTYFLLCTLLSSSLVMAQRRAKTPIGLLKKIHKLAQEKKYKKLQNYLYQGKVFDSPKKEMQGKTMADLIIMGIKKPLEDGRDFEYDADALEKIIKEHSNYINPISQKLRQKLFGREGKEFAQFKDLKAIADQRPNDIAIFDYKGVHILMAKFKKGYKLVFWENLKNITRKKSTYSKGGGEK